MYFPTGLCFKYKASCHNVKIKVSEHEMEVLVYLNEKHGGKLYLLSQLNLSHGINSTDLL